jgi:hypothetical protein
MLPIPAEAMEQSYQGLSLRRHIYWHFKSLWVTDQHRPWTHFKALVYSATRRSADYPITRLHIPRVRHDDLGWTLLWSQPREQFVIIAAASQLLLRPAALRRSVMICWILRGALQAPQTCLPAMLVICCWIGWHVPCAPLTLPSHFLGQQRAVAGGLFEATIYFRRLACSRPRGGRQ